MIGRSQPIALSETDGRTARIPILRNRQSDSACRTARPLNGGTGPDMAFDNGEQFPPVIRHVRTWQPTDLDDSLARSLILPNCDVW